MKQGSWGREARRGFIVCIPEMYFLGHIFQETSLLMSYLITFDSFSKVYYKVYHVQEQKFSNDSIWQITDIFMPKRIVVEFLVAIG